MTESLQIFYKKLNKFISKYHLVNLLQKLIIGISLILLIFATISLFNYFFYFDVNTKKLIFYLSLLIYAGIIYEFVILPLLPLFRIKRLDEYNAAIIISKLEPELKDVVVNILELSKNFDSTPLVLASIEQKIRSLKILDFEKLISFKSLKQVLKYPIFILVIFLALFIIKPQIIQEGSYKYLAYSKYFAKPSPINFKLLNKNLTVKQGSDFLIKLLTEGKFIPENVTIIVDNKEYLMQRTKSKNLFIYKLKNITQNIDFTFKIDNYYSKNYTLRVIPVPKLTKFYIKVIPPAYTKRKEQYLKNVTEINVPLGSKLLFTIKSKNSDTITIKEKSKIITKLTKKQSFTYQALENTQLTFIGTHDSIHAELINLNIKIIPDQYPKIYIKQIQDSNNLTLYYFVGNISDDYGFSSLKFFYQINNQEKQSIELPINKNLNNEPFAFNFNFSKLHLSSNDAVTYYFEVFDNDYISHFKGTKSQIFSLNIPSDLELSNKIDSTTTSINENMNDAQQLIYDIIQDIENIQQQLLNANLSPWEKQNLLNKLLSKQNELEALIKKANNLYQNLNKNLSTYGKQPKNLKTQAKTAQNIMDSLLNSNVRRLLKQIQNLMKNINAPNTQIKLNELKLNYKDLSNRLKQELEILKRLSIQQELHQQANALQNLGQKEDSLSSITHKTSKRDTNQLNKLKQTQKNIANQLQNLNQEYNKLLHKNHQLNNPYNLINLDTAFEKLNKQLEQIQQLLDKNKTRKASKLQQKASQKIKSLSQMMKNMIQNSQIKANIENLSQLRRLKTNLLNLSFNIEKRYKKISTFFNGSPALKNEIIPIKLLDNQLNTQKDSLFNLAIRNPQIYKPINDNFRNITVNFNKTINALTRRNKANALNYLQLSLQYTNNLVLLLDEMISNIQNMLKNALPSQGNGKQQMQNLTKINSLQNKLQQALKQLQQEAKTTQNGNKGTNYKKLVEILKLEEQFEQELQNYLKNNTLTPKLQQQINTINKLLKQTKKDILYQNITPNTIRRQELIKVKLWEAENALKKQGYDNKRKAEVGKDIFNRDVKLILKKYQKYIDERENINYNYIEISDFYKKIYQKYLNQLKPNK